MSCYPHAWDAIWRAFDGTRMDKVLVLKTDLDELVACTERPRPAGLVILLGDKFAHCHRATLFELLNQHGKEPCRCEKVSA